MAVETHLGSDKLRKHVHGDLHARDSGHETDGDDEDQSHDNTEENDSGGGVSLPRADADHSSDDGHGEDDEVPPLGDLLVSPHETHVDVLGEVVGTLRLLAAGLDAAPHRLEAHSNLLAVEQGRVRDGRGVVGEEPEVDRQVTGSHVRHRVSLVLAESQRGDTTRRGGGQSPLTPRLGYLGGRWSAGRRMPRRCCRRCGSS